MKNKNIGKYRVIGLMSGTSLDGVDVACCHFQYKNGKWNFSIEVAETFSYSMEWRKKLASAHLFSGEVLIQLHSAYGNFLGNLCNEFISKHSLKKIDLIASHGHTIFHQPKNGFTFQLGDGNAIHAGTDVPVVYDFRSLDVALSGEGAPLVPIGDQLLFSENDACLNLGGIVNISLTKNKKRFAFDICYCNLALNFLAAKTNKDFDENGSMAAIGKVDEKLFSALRKIYAKLRKKRLSLAREGFEKEIIPLLEDESVSLPDRLRTVSESIAEEIAVAVPSKKINLLATGGGVHNLFLIQLIQQKLSPSKIIVPDKVIIDFKEALVFAFLGVLRMRKQTNVLKSVTGAKRDSCSGVLIG